VAVEVILPCACYLSILGKKATISQVLLGYIPQSQQFILKTCVLKLCSNSLQQSWTLWIDGFVVGLKGQIVVVGVTYMFYKMTSVQNKEFFYYEHLEFQH
jgi:hypothetical protein